MTITIDFHSHILPGIDDGSHNTAMTRDMLSMAAAQGVNVMCATPHFYAERNTIDRFLTRRAAALEKAQGPAGEQNIRLIPAAEVAFFRGISRADRIEELCFKGTNLLMVEMPFRPWTGSELEEIEDLIKRGMTPVMAHIERFYQYQKDKSMIPELLAMPVYVQVNAECLTGFLSRRTPLSLFKNGQAHLLGSDCHNTDSRRPNLKEGRDVIEKKLGKDILTKIDRTGAELLGL